MIEIDVSQRLAIIEHLFTIFTGNTAFSGNINTIIVQHFRINPCNYTAVLIGRNIVMVLRRPP